MTKYTFGCGHSADVYLGAKDKSGNNGRYCPICFDLTKPVSGAHNVCRRLTQIENPCEQCGKPVIKTGHSMNMMKYYLCEKCRLKKELEQQRKSKEKQHILKAANALEKDPETAKGLKVLVTCPKCRRQRYMRSHKQFNTQAVLWKYCNSCSEYKRRYADNDNAIYAGRGNDTGLNVKGAGAR